MPADLIGALVRATMCRDDLARGATALGFRRAAPGAREVVRLIRENAAKSAAFGRAYDALLDGYEPGIGTAEVDDLFEPLAAFLPDFLERVLAHQAPPLPLQGTFRRPRRRRSASN